MIEVIVVGEGQTEERFVRDILAPFLVGREIFLHPRLISTSTANRGGALTPQRVMRYLRNTLRERSDVYVTTFFDLYGLNAEFPGFAETKAIADPLQRASHIESSLAQAVVREAQCCPERFIPHIQPYEFEALLFADCTRWLDIEPSWGKYQQILQAARLGSHTPEHINDGVKTHPAARLGVLTLPRFQKVLHGPDAVARIGIERIRVECKHFDSWLSQIETLPPLP